jgi:hypothetical protein
MAIEPTTLEEEIHPFRQEIELDVPIFKAAQTKVQRKLSRHHEFLH